MLAPLSTATSARQSCPDALATHVFRPATASAPAGSMMLRVSSNTSLIAAQISSLVTRTTSSTVCCAIAKVQLAHLAHGDAVGEDADVVERHAPARLQRAVHRVGLERLDADRPARPASQRLDVAGDAGDQSAAADGHEHGRQRPLALAQDLLADRALPGDHQRVVERVDERSRRSRRQLVAAHLGVGVAVAAQHDLGAELAHRLDLDLGRGPRHHDHGADAELARRVGDALRVVAGAGRDDAARALGLGQVRDAVVGARAA